MSNLQGVNIQKGRLGANRLSSSDAISGIIISAVAVSSLAVDTPITVYNMNSGNYGRIRQNKQAELLPAFV